MRPVCYRYTISLLVEQEGIEPSFPACKTGVLPLNDNPIGTSSAPILALEAGSSSAGRLGNVAWYAFGAALVNSWSGREDSNL